MAAARKKDEWFRCGSIVATVENRTNFDAKAKPLDALDCMPQWLVTTQDRLAAAKAKQKSIGRVPVSAIEIGAMMGVKPVQKSFDELYPNTEG